MLRLRAELILYINVYKQRDTAPLIADEFFKREIFPAYVAIFSIICYKQRDATPLIADVFFKRDIFSRACCYFLNYML